MMVSSNYVKWLMTMILMIRADTILAIESQGEPTEDEYYQYYTEVEKRQKLIDFGEKVTESTITLWTVMKPFFLTFLGTIIVIVVCLLLFLCICIGLSFDWSRMFSLIEYCPCISHSKLRARFEQLRYPGLYHKQKGRIEHYKASSDERDLIQDIEFRLQT